MDFSTLALAESYADELHGNYEHIETIELAEDAYSIERMAWPDGKPYSFKSVAIVAKTVVGTGEAHILCFAYLEDGNSDYRAINSAISNSSQRYWQFEAEVRNNRFNVRSRSVISERDYQSNMFAPATDKFGVSGNINRLVWRSQNASINIPAGSTFEIWAVRA